MVENGRYSQNLQSFYIDVEDREEGVKPYKAIWTKAPHGVYLTILTQLPINIDGTYSHVPGYATVFSQHPEFMARLFLWKDSEERPKPDEKEIQSKLEVIAARYEHDIMQKNPRTGAEHLVTSWAKSAIYKHSGVTAHLLKRHGSFIMDGDSIMRSGSSIIWANPAKSDPSKVDCYYYSNPAFGKVILFINDYILSSNFSKKVLKATSIKLNDEPMDKSDFKLFAHQEATRLSKKIIRAEEPYDLSKSDKKISRYKRKFKNGAVRFVQRAIHIVYNNIKPILVSLAIMGALVLTTSISPLLFAAGGGKSNFLMKGASGLFKKAKEILSPLSTVKFNSFRDVSALMASYERAKYFTDDNRGITMNHHFVGHMRALPSEYTSNTFPGAVEYDADHEAQWARAVLLDTLGIQPGAIYSEVEVNGTQFLKAEQPNGLDVYYDPEELIAFAHIAREPFDNTCLEKPIKHLFDKLSPENKFIGLRINADQEIQQIDFASLDDIPAEYNHSRASSMQELGEAGLGIKDLMNTKSFPLLSVIPPQLVKKEIKKNKKIAAKYIKNAFKGGVLDEGAYRPVTMSDNVERYMDDKDRGQVKANSIVYDDFAKFSDRRNLRDSVKFHPSAVPSNDISQISYAHVAALGL